MKFTIPIFLFDYKDIGVDIVALKSKIASFYGEFQPDYYLLHKRKIDFLFQNNLLKSKDYTIDIASLDLPNGITKTLDSFVSNRKRLISEYRIKIKEKDINILRIPSSPFVQVNANSLEKLDYRHYARKFKELPNELFDDNLVKIIKFVFLEIKKFLDFSEAHLIIHHTLIECINGESATNSPEGIHQDGMDYIVSAFVVESQNICGAKSILYLEDKKTKIFQTTLKEGQGILQADKDSFLWHKVTDIQPIHSDLPAFRSSIGFDIEII